MLLVCCSNVESSPPFARSYMKKNPVAMIRSYGKKIQFLLIACKNQFWLSRTLSRPYKTFKPNNNNTAAILGHLTSVLILSMRTNVSRKADQIQRQCSLFSVANTAIKGDFETIALAPNKGLLIQEGNSNSLL